MNNWVNTEKNNKIKNPMRIIIIIAVTILILFFISLSIYFIIDNSSKNHSNKNAPLNNENNQNVITNEDNVTNDEKNIVTNEDEQSNDQPKNNGISYTKKTKIIKFLEDNLAFSEVYYNDVNQIYGSTIAHYIYDYSDGPKLSEEQKNFIISRYGNKITEDYYTYLDIYMDADLVSTYYRNMTNHTFNNFDSADCIIYIKEYNIYVHFAGHGTCDSETSSFGINCEGNWYLYDINSIIPSNDNNYLIDVTYYSVLNAEDFGSSDELKNKIDDYYKGNVTAKELGLIKLSDAIFTIEMNDNNWYFISNIEK